jgi:glucose-1-phosphate cytidylyltransferase
MKVVILCGGRGTRLNEETEFKPKPMVMVGDRPMLWHIMRLYSHYGYNDFVLCLGYKGNAIKNYFLNHDELVHDFTLKLGSGSKTISHHANKTPHWNITFADTGLVCDTGSRVARIKKYIRDDENFFLTYGDGLADINIPKLLDYHQKQNKIVTVTSIRPPNPFGVLEIDDRNHITSFAEKHQSKDWTNGGFFVCNKKVFNYLDDKGQCIFEQGPVQKMAQEKQLVAYKHHDFWHCVDTLKHAEGLNSLYNKGTRPWMVWES